MEQVLRLEIPEYELLMKAARLRWVDEEYRTHEQAFLNVYARATRGKKGRPVYKTFKDFFDYEKALEKIRTGTKRRDVLDAVSALMHKKHKEKEDG